MIKQHTVMAEDILNTEGKSALDASCLKLLSHKQILARIAKRCVEEVSSYSIREIMDFIEGDPLCQRKARDFLQNTEKIIGMNTVDKDPQEGEVIYDILFRMRIPGEEDAIEVILNIEAQQKYPSSYPLLKRGMYYGSKIIVKQKNTEFEHSHYEKIKKVYSIWIVVNAPLEMRNTITSYAMQPEAVLGDYAAPREEYDLLELVTICLGGPGFPRYEDLVRMLDVLVNNHLKALDKCRILEEDYDIQMTKEIGEEVDCMCNLSQGILEEGKEIGSEQKEIECIRKLMQNAGWSQIEVFKMFDIPEAEWSRYSMLLEEKSQISESSENLASKTYEK